MPGRPTPGAVASEPQLSPDPAAVAPEPQPLQVPAAATTADSCWLRPRAPYSTGSSLLSSCSRSNLGSLAVPPSSCARSNSGSLAVPPSSWARSNSGSPAAPRDPVSRSHLPVRPPSCPSSRSLWWVGSSRPSSGPRHPP
ncbi:hypothetical protein VZT92_008354 [Zoarces viviparus]|uniref:Uncharacterized protein n=1 Tax=Zoarces viviparus TaxID=48416 RepID=A0AAW1FFN9_ZOAVI